MRPDLFEIGLAQRKATLGADYVQTGSVNQGCVESGLGETARALTDLIVGIDEVAESIRAANVNLPLGALDGCLTKGAARPASRRSRRAGSGRRRRPAGSRRGRRHRSRAAPCRASAGA